MPASPGLRRANQATAPDIRVGMLRHSEQRLLELVRRVGYGRLGNILVRRGEPILARGLTTRRRICLGRGDAFAVPRAPPVDFKLRQQHVDLITQIRLVQDGIVRIEIQDGLPVGLIVEEAHGR